MLARYSSSAHAPFLAAAALVLLIAAAVWPGFMSWDSVFALQQAREGITSSAYPPVMSYLWRTTELLIPGPGGKLLLQVGVLVGALAWFVQILRLPPAYGVASLIAVVSMPIVLGPVLVVWKDIGMSAFLTLGTAMIIAGVMDRRSGLKLAGLAAIAIGSSYRLNAFPAVIPLMLWLAWHDTTVARASLASKLRGVAVRAGLSSLAILIVISVGLTWRLPDFRRLPASFNPWWTQVYDILGVSVCTGQALVPKEFFPAPTSIEGLTAIYRPQHIQESFNMAGKPGSNLMRIEGFNEFGTERLRLLWYATVTSHPGCYLRHRLTVMSYALGANSGSVFYITHPHLDENPYGFSHKPTLLTRALVGWVTADTLGARLWILMLAGLAAVTYTMWRKRSGGFLALAIYSSGVAYMAGNFIVIPAADARYHHWTAVASAMCIIVALAAWVGRGARTDGEEA